MSVPGDGQNQPPPQLDAIPSPAGAPQNQLAINFYGGMGMGAGWPLQPGTFGASEETMAQFPSLPFSAFGKSNDDEKAITNSILSSFSNYTSDNATLTAGTVGLEGAAVIPGTSAGQHLELMRDTPGGEPGDSSIPSSNANADPAAGIQDTKEKPSEPSEPKDTTDKTKTPIEFITKTKDANIIFDEEGNIVGAKPDANGDGKRDTTLKIYGPPGVDTEKAWESFSEFQETYNINSNLSKDDFIKQLEESSAQSTEAVRPGGGTSPARGPSKGGQSSCGPNGCGGKGGAKGGGGGGGGGSGGGGGDSGGGGGGSGGGGGDTGGGSPRGTETPSDPSDSSAQPRGPSDQTREPEAPADAPTRGDRTRGIPSVPAAETHLPYGIRNTAEQAVFNGRTHPIPPMTYANFASMFFRSARFFAAVDKNGDGKITPDEIEEAKTDGSWDTLGEELDKTVAEMSKEDPDSKDALTALSTQFKDHANKDFHQNLANLMTAQKSGQVTPEAVDKVFGPDQIMVNGSPIANTTKTAIISRLLNGLSDVDHPDIKDIRKQVAEPAQGSQEIYKQNRQKILDLLRDPANDYSSAPHPLKREQVNKVSRPPAPKGSYYIADGETGNIELRDEGPVSDIGRARPAGSHPGRFYAVNGETGNIELADEGPVSDIGRARPAGTHPGRFYELNGKTGKIELRDEGPVLQ